MYGGLEGEGGRGGVTAVQASLSPGLHQAVARGKEDVSNVSCGGEVAVVTLDFPIYPQYGSILLLLLLPLHRQIHPYYRGFHPTASLFPLLPDLPASLSSLAPLFSSPNCYYPYSVLMERLSRKTAVSLYGA